MLSSRSNASLLHLRKFGSQLLHQYHIHTCLSVPTLAPRASQIASDFSFSQSANSSSRLSQVARHLSTKSSQSTNMSSYSVRKVGQPYTLDHRVYIEKDGVVVSPFHDIPLYANEQQTILNMIVEIPRWTNAKMEVCILL